jgi:hypothetical protein
MTARPSKRLAEGHGGRRPSLQRLHDKGFRRHSRRVRGLVRSKTKVDYNSIPRVPIGVLHRPIRSQPAVASHSGKTDPGTDGSNRAVTRHVIGLMTLPKSTVDMPHRHRAVEDVKEVLLPRKRTTLKIRVPPDPGASDIVMKGELVKRDSYFLIENNSRVRGIAVAQVGLVTAGRNS